ncbi:MAG: helix-turn-helix domain-containing protein [Bacteroidales bacterium]|nr:helix-turn-helix domain-containing protein [Bacteroidales bacterium]
MKPIYEKINKPEDQSFYFEEVSKPYFTDLWHFHPEIEILCIKEGYGTKYVGDSINTYFPGDVVIIGSNTPHVWASNPDFLNPENKLTSSAICIQFGKDFLGKSFSGIPEFRKIGGFLNETYRGIQFVKESRSILEERINGLSSRLGMDKLIGLMKILDIMAGSNDIKYLSSPSYIPIKINSEDRDRMEIIFRYVIENYSKKIALEDIASKVNLTPHSFCRYFKSRTTKVFSSFVNEVRIGNACKMIIQNKDSISEICYASGFNYLSNFNRQFKKIRKMTPSEFQKKSNELNFDLLYDK